jgi:four helix bundle protein
VEDSVPVFAVELRRRTKSFALQVPKLVDTLPRGISSDAIARQLIRSATSVAANYRAAQRGRSKAEFIAKIGIVVEEADETVFWLEMLAEGEIVNSQRIKQLQTEATELLKIFAASQRTARK